MPPVKENVSAFCFWRAFTIPQVAGYHYCIVMEHFMRLRRHLIATLLVLAMGATVIPCVSLQAQSKSDQASSPARTPKTLVSVWAHTDDDAAVAPLLARYAREGVQVYTIIATDGSQGCKHTTVPCGSDLAHARSEEARCSCDALGIHPPILLGFPDGKLGDYVGDPSLMPRLTQRIAEELQKLHADAIITWGPDGGTGHPDHRIISDVVTQLVRASAPGAPEQLFYAYLPPQAGFTPPPLLLPQKKYFTVQVPVTLSDYDAFRRFMACQKTQFSADELKRVAAAPLGGPVRLVPALSTGAGTDVFEPLR
jgi:LmbE family N-acetylglucosaminyl deacetylase